MAVLEISSGKLVLTSMVMWKNMYARNKLL